MTPAIANALLTLAQAPARVPLDKLRIGAALLMGVAIFTIVFATLWLMSARRRSRAEAALTKKRRGRPATAWDESARRLRLPPDDDLDDDDTRDIDPSDLSPGDVDLRPDDDADDDDSPPGSGRSGKGRTR
jgi:hypothetical protein